MNSTGERQSISLQFEDLFGKFTSECSFFQICTRENPCYRLFKALCLSLFISYSGKRQHPWSFIYLQQVSKVLPNISIMLTTLRTFSSELLKSWHDLPKCSKIFRSSRLALKLTSNGCRKFSTYSELTSEIFIVICPCKRFCTPI